MDDKQNIEINELMTQDSGEVIIRRGDAQKYRYPEGITVSGTLGSARQWWQINHPKEIFECKHSRLEYCTDPDQGLFIKLFYHQVYNDTRTTVKGSLITHPVLKEFGINTKEWTVKALAKFIRRNRRFFSTNDMAMRLYNELMSFRARITKDYTDTDDNRGNIEKAVKITTEQNFADNISVSLPLFKGMDNDRVRFEMDIVIFPTENGVVLQFDCAEYEEIFDAHIKNMFTEHLEFFKGKVPVIEVYN